MNFWALFWPKVQKQQGSYDLSLDDNIGIHVDTIQDFLRKLGMKPHVHLVEISIFSLNNVIIRPTKIIKDLF